ncbi:MAG: helix-turn-helix domain-containing [Desulfovibrionaceae bacterium]|nr:MAG: helix-turn-helix domain-containing [Desulfovibrionaceae bacterium]
MLELTRTPLTDGMVCLTINVPREKADGIAAAVEGILRLVETPGEATVPAVEVLPDMTPGKVLRGARGLRGLTQEQLAQAVGAQKSHISEMEREVRPIGLGMAQRLGKALAMPHKSFL